jgi:hypothetical protein
MTRQEEISLVSAVIAATSLTANLVMGIIIYRLNRSNLKRDDVLAVFRSLLHRLEVTRLFEVDPEQELWEFGFESLGELASQCAPATLAAQSRKLVPPEVRTSVSKLSEHVKSLRALQDSWRLFRNKKEGDWRSIQRSWPDIERATAALKAAQPVAAHCKRTLSSFLGKA